MMKRLFTGASLLVFASSAFAADMSVVPLKAPAPAAWSWSGLYIGVHMGSAMGLSNVNDPLGPSIFGDQIHSPGLFGGGQIGFNWQAPSSSWVFGRCPLIEFRLLLTLTNRSGLRPSFPARLICCPAFRRWGA